MANSKLKKFGEIPNLYIDEITGIFYVRIYHGKTTRVKSLKTKSFVTAKTKIKTAIKEIVTTNKRSLKNTLVGDYFTDFWNSLIAEGLSDDTLKQNASSWKNHVAPFWAKVPDNEIDHNKFVEYLAWHKKTKGGTIYNALKVLRKIVSHMRKQGAPIGSIEIEVPKRERDKMNEETGTYITDAEIKDILAVGMTPQMRFKILGAYTIGFRIGELVNLERDRIKMPQIHFQAKDTKTRKPRIAPLTEELSGLLKGILTSHKERYVFHALKNPKEPTSKQVVERAWKRILKEAGIRRRIRFHDLRHTAATNMAKLGIDPVVACAILGMSLKMYMSTYVKKHKLNLNSVAETLSQKGGRP